MDVQMLFGGFLMAVGLITFSTHVIKFLNLIYQLIRPRKSLKELGEWSVVTGPTSGIGYAVAMELARNQQNLILIGRNETKLKKVEKEIKEEIKNKNISIVSLVIDLSQISDRDIAAYTECIRTRDVGILFNNAGLAYDYTKYFDEVEMQRVDSIMNVNMRALTLLTHLTINKMISNKRGAVVNVSSAGGILPHELHAVYGASKSYVIKLTNDLALEYTRKGVSFQAQIPYFVVSNMSKVRKSSLTVPSAESYAGYAVAQIGYSGVISPHPVHALMNFVLGLVPNFILERQIGSLHHRIRKKGHKKHGVKKTD